jgi:type IV secretory pathway TrbD component
MRRKKKAASDDYWEEMRRLGMPEHLIYEARHGRLVPEGVLLGFLAFGVLFLMLVGFGLLIWKLISLL